LALAIVDKERRPEHLTIVEYWNDVIHRHAHRMRDQAVGQIFVYRSSIRRTEIKL
jgi:hypothetical protein